MVQVIQQSPAQVRSQEQLLSGLEKALTQANQFATEQQQYQRDRGRLQQALGQVSDTAKPGSTPLQTTLSFLNAMAGIPGSERYVAQVLPQIISQAQAQITPSPGEIKGSGGGTSQMPPAASIGTMGQAPQEAQRGPGPVSAETSSGQQIINTLGQYIPLDVGDLISPEEKSNIIAKVNRAGGDVNFAKSQIDDYNRGKIDFNDLQNAQVDKLASQRARQRKMEEDLRGFVDRQYENDAESDKNIYYDILKREVPKHEDYTSAQNRVAKVIEDYKQQRDIVLKNIPEASTLGVPNDKFGGYKGAASNLMKISPLAYNVIEQGWVDKGHSPVQPALIYNPLPKDIEKVVEKATDSKDLLYPSYMGDISDKARMRTIDMAQAQQTKQIPSIAKDLENKWNDKLSLLNIYADLRKKAWFPQQIQELFEKLEQDGVEFSSQQSKERAYIQNNPPVPAYKLM